MKLITAIALTCLAAGCRTTEHYATRPDSVTIITYTAASPQVVRVTKTELTAECEALFPCYKSLPAGDNAGGWEVSYEFYFNFGGTSLLVISDGKKWSNSRGDFLVSGDIEQVLKKLQE